MTIVWTAGRHAYADSVTPLRRAIEQRSTARALEEIKQRKFWGLEAGIEGGQSLLHRAIEFGNELSVVEGLLELDRKRIKAILQFADSEGTTPMLAAAQVANAEVIELLAKAGANLEVRDRYQRTPLYLAMQFPTPAPKNREVALEKTLNAVKALVKWGVSLHGLDAQRQSLLQAYIKAGPLVLDPKMIAFLISEEAPCPSRKEVDQVGPPHASLIHAAIDEGLRRRTKELTDKIPGPLIAVVQSYIRSSPLDV